MVFKDNFIRTVFLQMKKASKSYRCNENVEKSLSNTIVIVIKIRKKKNKKRSNLLLKKKKEIGVRTLIDYSHKSANASHFTMGKRERFDVDRVNCFTPFSTILPYNTLCSIHSSKPSSLIAMGNSMSVVQNSTIRKFTSSHFALRINLIYSFITLKKFSKLL